MKIDDFDFRGLPQSLVDFKDQVFNLVNFGKFQKQIVSSAPSWRARRGEEVYYISGNTGRLYMCSSDNSTNWVIVATFTP